MNNIMMSDALHDLPPFQGVIQAKVEVGHQVKDFWIWDPKLQKSRKIYMVKINERAKPK